MTTTMKARKELNNVSKGSMNFEFALTGHYDDYVVNEGSFYAAYRKSLFYKVFAVNGGYQAVARLGGLNNPTFEAFSTSVFPSTEDILEYLLKLY